MMPRLAFLALAYSALSRSMLVILSAIAACFLGETDFGVFSFLILTAASVATLSAVGLGATCNTLTARNQAERPNLVAGILAFALLATFAFSVPISLLWWVFTPIDVISQLGAVATFAMIFAVSFLMAIANAAEGTCYGLSAYPALVRVGVSALVIAVGLALILTSAIGLPGALIALFVGRLTSVILLARVIFSNSALRPSFVALSRNRAEVLGLFAKIGVPVALAGALASPVIAAAINLVARNGGIVEVGHFNLVYQVFLISVYPVTSLSQYMLSRFSTPGGEKQRSLNRAITIAAAYGTAVALALVATPSVLQSLALIDTSAPMLGLWFGAAGLLYSIHLVFTGYWPSIGMSWMILAAQVLWAVAVFGSISDGATAANLARGFALGSLLQVACDIFAKISRPSQRNAQ